MPSLHPPLPSIAPPPLLSLPFQVMTSVYGIVWNPRTAINNYQWYDVTVGRPSGVAQFCAVAQTGTGNRVMTSTDGYNRVARNTPADNDWQGVAWGGPAPGRYIAVALTGNNNRIMTSTTGGGWTTVTSPANYEWRAVSWGGGLFVAVASSGTGNRVMTSATGLAPWTLRQSAADYNWNDVVWGDPDGVGTWVAVARELTTPTFDSVMTSNDGVSWTLRTTPSNNAWYSVTWGSNRFVAVGVSGTGNRVMTSPDGIVWTLGISAADTPWHGVVAGLNGRFVAVGGGPNPPKAMYRVY